MVSRFSVFILTSTGFKHELCFQRDSKLYLHFCCKRWFKARIHFGRSEACSIHVHFRHGGKRSSVVGESEFKNPKTLGSIPWWGSVKNIFSVPTSPALMQTCLCLTPPPPFVCTARTQICAQFKDPISICRKSVGLTASGTETRKHYIQDKRKENKLGSAAILSLLAFPRESSPNFPCIATSVTSKFLDSFGA